MDSCGKYLKSSNSTGRPIDMITTSEVAVSLTVDSDKHLDEIVAELEKLGTIEIERNNSIVCVVGRMEHGDAGLAARVFESIRKIPIKMISYGAQPPQSGHFDRHRTEKAGHYNHLTTVLFQ